MISFITAIIALIGFAYSLGYVHGKIVTDINWLKDQVKWFRDRFVNELIILTLRKNFMTYSSPEFRLTEKDWKLLRDDLRKAIEDFINSKKGKKLLKRLKP